MDQQSLVHELQAAVGQQYVLHLPEDLLVYESDGSVDRGTPRAVVLPGSAEQVAAVVRVTRGHQVPLVPRGAGTGLSGGAVAADGAVLMPLVRLDHILEIDPDSMLAVVEPGVVNLDISRAAAKYGLAYAPDPSSQRACTIGGNVAENAGGPHCLAYGVTTNHVLGLEVVLADGTVTWLGGRGYMGPGYDLRSIVIGSEGTLAVVTKIVVRLMPRPEAVRTLLAIFRSVDQASAAVSGVIASGMVPAALEMMDRLAIQAVEAAVHAGYPSDAGAVLLVEVEGLREKVAEEAPIVDELCRRHRAMALRWAEDEETRERLWAGRKGALGALGRLAPNYYLLDGVVPRARVLEALRRIDQVSRQYRLPIANVFHAGDGNLHPCILFDERRADELQRAREAGGAVLRACVELGGALSGEHGVGIEKREYMPLCFNQADLAAMARLRTAFDALLLNPGKVFPSQSQVSEAPWRGVASRLAPDAII